jgi:hypothetical protein
MIPQLPRPHMRPMAVGEMGLENSASWVERICGRGAGVCGGVEVQAG